MHRWLLLLVAGCGRIAFDPLGDGDGGTADGRPDARDFTNCTPWSNVVRLDNLASTQQDWEPAIHPNGNYLVFQSNRINPGTSAELYVSQRSGPGGTFGAGTVISSISDATTIFDTGPTWTSDGSQLYFVSDRSGLPELWTSNMAGGAFLAPVKVASLAGERFNAPTLRYDGLELYYDDYDPAFSNTRMHRATRATVASPWVPQGIQTQFDMGGGAAGWPALSPDGLTLYYEAFDGIVERLYATTRASIGDTFPQGVQMNDVFDVNTVGLGDPDFSFDGLTLFYASTRMATTTLNDIFMATRTCL